PPLPPTTDLNADILPRLHRGLAGLQLLHQLQPARRPAPSTASSTVPVGRLPWTHLGRFQLRREIGRGGFGIVYLAYGPVPGREVALKGPHAGAALDPGLRERFQREARAASALEHPHVVPVYEAGEVGPVCFLVSAYCPGVTLAQWLRARVEPV